MTLYAGTDHPFDGSTPQRVYKSTDAGVTWRQTGLDAGGLLDRRHRHRSRRRIARRRGQPRRRRLLPEPRRRRILDGRLAPDGLRLRRNPHDPLREGDRRHSARRDATASAARWTAEPTWTRHGVANLGSVYDLLFDPTDPSVVYAAVSPLVSGGTGGVFASTDGGRHLVGPRNRPVDFLGALARPRLVRARRSTPASPGAASRPSRSKRPNAPFRCPRPRNKPRAWSFPAERTLFREYPSDSNCWMLVDFPTADSP